MGAFYYPKALEFAQLLRTWQSLAVRLPAKAQIDYNLSYIYFIRERLQHESKRAANYRPLDNEFQIKEVLQDACNVINAKDNVFEKA